MKSFQHATWRSGYQIEKQNNANTHTHTNQVYVLKCTRQCTPSQGSPLRQGQGSKASWLRADLWGSRDIVGGSEGLKMSLLPGT